MGAVHGAAVGSGDGEFVGRTRELAAVRACAAAASRREPWTVTVEGEAGIGKTWLVRQALRGVPGLTVWWARCDPAERDWPYGVVEQWLRRVDPDVLAGFPVLSGRLGPSTSPIQVGIELLEMLYSLQEEQPLALVVDDVQAADDASLAVLGFVARRLRTQRLLVVATARTGPAAEGGAAPERERSADSVGQWRRQLSGASRARTVSLGGLEAHDVAGWVAAVSGEDTSPAVTRRLMEHTGGHPLYLQAVLAMTDSAQLTEFGEHLPVPPSLTATVHAVLDGLGPRARALVEALAVLDSRAPLSQVVRLAGLEGPGEEAVRSAVDCGLVLRWTGNPVELVSIRHILQRDAVYATLSPNRRRALHAVAAKLVDPDAAWLHRVTAADQSDRVLADELEAEAGRQQRADQTERAATLLRWAADLSDSRSEYERRLLIAAVHLHAMPYGSGPRRFALQELVLQCAPSALRSCVLGRIAYAHGSLSTGEQHYQDAIATARATGDLRTEVRAQVWLASLYNWRAEHPERSLAMLREVLGSGLLDPPSRVEARFGLILAHGLCHGSQAALTACADELALPDDPAMVSADDQVVLAMRGVFRLNIGAVADARADALTVLQPINAGTGLATLFARKTLALCLYLAGEWDEATRYATEALSQSRLEGLWSGLPEAHAYAAMVAAGQGRQGSARDHLEACQDWSERLSPAMYRALPALAGATVAQAEGDPVAMLRCLEPLKDLPDTGWHRFARQVELPLRAEALVGCGLLDEAADTVEQLRGLSVRTCALRPVLAWAEGRLAEAAEEPAEAEAAYRRGLAERVTADDIPLYRARLEHDLGRTLVRSGRTRLGAVRLCGARQRFEALGAAAFIERLDMELVGLGLRADPGSVGFAAGGRRTGPTTRTDLYIVDVDVLGGWADEVSRSSLLAGGPDRG